ncbi:MAG: glycosyltransferase family 9 protein [Thermoleophilia bacterium]
MAPLLIANNSGLAHLAAAVGTPVVDLYALTNPQHAPWGVPARVLSHDAVRRVLRSVCPEGHSPVPARRRPRARRRGGARARRHGAGRGPPRDAEALPG